MGLLLADEGRMNLILTLPSELGAITRLRCVKKTLVVYTATGARILLPRGKK